MASHFFLVRFCLRKCPIRTCLQRLMSPPQCRPLTTQTLCEVTHGEVRLLEGMTFPARHGYNFKIALSSLDTEGDESMSLVQLGFRKIFHSIHSLASTVQQGKRVHPGEGPDQTEMHARPITVTIVPPIRQGNPSNSFEFLHFHSVLQSFWQPLSLLSADRHDPSVLVTTWYLDHVRFPQCFVARDVRLYSDPEEWTHLMRMAWRELVLHDQPLHFHVVQPAPIEMEVNIALHVLLVQQPIRHFDAVLVSTVDSDCNGMPPQRHASMAPHMLPFSTLIGLAINRRTHVLHGRPIER